MFNLYILSFSINEALENEDCKDMYFISGIRSDRLMT